MDRFRSASLRGDAGKSSAHSPEFLSIWPDPGGDCGISVAGLGIGAHTSTSVDAARHAHPGGRGIEEYPLGTFVGRGVVLDVPRKGITALTASDLEKVSPRVEDSDLVLFRFGYGDRFGHPGYDSPPYLSEDAAEFLIECRARLVGVDTLTPELPHNARGAHFGFPIHRLLLAHDILMVENLGPGVQAVASRRLVLRAMPLRIVGGDGVPVAPFGALQEPF